ncbi:MFS transporter [uncultured Propionibacterium sp.]|uniref:MFS transporter n=1 Tax=uncultured Propionibacterium sp. TaxID=218066 RepID=UPI00292D379D|nr:MFS transporter [uncultured Propionibacterium sp.]
MTADLDTRPAQAAPPTRRGLVLVSAVIVQLMIVLDMTIIAIALPDMQADLGMTATQRPWAVTAYTLAFGGLVLFGGRVVSTLGLRRSYAIALSGFALASLAGGLAQSFATLAAARAVQGTFAALLAPTVLALVSSTFPDRGARTRAFSALGATGGLGAAAGLLIGGALTDALSWRWALYVNLMIAACALLIGARHVPVAVREPSQDRITDDLFGLVLGCAGIFSVVYGLDRAQQNSWTARSTLTWLGVGVALLAAFVLRERLAARPVLPLWILASGSRAFSYAAQFFTGAAQMGGLVYLTYYLQNHFGYSPLRTGVAFLPMVGTVIITALVVGRLLVPRLGVGALLSAGLLIEGIAFLVLARVSFDASYAQVALPGLLVVGAGAGIVTPVAFNNGTSGVPAERSGLASAVLSASQQIGSSLGVALLAARAEHVAETYASDRAGELQQQIVGALTGAGATPDSPAGQSIIARLRDDLASHAQIQAYASGFALMAWMLVGAGALLAAVTAILAVAHRRRS